MESLQELLDKNDYETVMKKFEVVKARLWNKNYYEWRFVKELERFVLETMDYEDEEGEV